MTNEELDGYLVLILFMLKKEKSLPSRKPSKILVKGNIRKRVAEGLYNNLVYEMQIGNREFHFK